MPKKSDGLGSDLNRVDAHVIQPHEYDEIPELGEEFFAHADLHHDTKLVQRGTDGRGAEIAHGG